MDFHQPPEWFAKIESLATLAGRLPAIPEGKDCPKDVAERLDLAQICYDKKLYATALRFWAQALDEDPKLGDNRRAQHRYNAACSALLFAFGRGEDATPLDDAARFDLRCRAVAWLRAELAAWSKLLETGSPRDHTTTVTTIRWWPRDPDLAAVRDVDALANHPEAERKDWLALWDGVDSLIRKARKANSR